MVVTEAATFFRSSKLSNNSLLLARSSLLESSSSSVEIYSILTVTPSYTESVSFDSEERLLALLKCVEVLHFPRKGIPLPSDEIDLRHIDLKAHTGIVVRLEMEDHEEKGHH